MGQTDRQTMGGRQNGGPQHTDRQRVSMGEAITIYITYEVKGLRNGTGDNLRKFISGLLPVMK